MESPASSFLSDRGYHPSRRSFRQTDGRQRSDGEAPGPIGDLRKLPSTSICRRAAGSFTAFGAGPRSIPRAAPPPASGVARCSLG